MNIQRVLRTVFVGTCAASALSVGTSLLGLGQTQYRQEGASSTRSAQGVEFLTRGPVHEAFAEPVVFRAEAEFIISQEPPDPIDELPPEQGPEGGIWMPGYWSWDDDEGHFIWVSGFWRIVPPDMDWVPGYWAEVDNGYQWVSGFWKSIEVEEVSYLPEPPQVIDETPAGNPPSADHVWVPGIWTWHEHRYVWRPGYYVQARPGWIWSPAHYVWTPTGYIFNDGFWDLSVRRRGVLFAPAYFDNYVAGSFVYTPSVVVDADLFVDHLFVHPGHRHYYFGDYYDYVGVGFYPWFEFHLGHYGYDPIFSYYNWHYSRRDRNWVNHLRDDFRHRRDHRDARPPHRFSEMQRIAERGSRRDQSRVIATSFDKFVSKEKTQFKFTKFEENRRQEIKNLVKKDREFQKQRAKLESEKDKSALTSKEARKVKLANSPLAAVARERAGKEKAPEKPKTPDLDESKQPGTRDARRDQDRDRSRQAERDRDADRDRTRQADRDRDTDRDRTRQADRDRDMDRDRTRQADRDRSTKADRSKDEQPRNRTAEQPKAKEDRRERGYTRPDDTSKQKAGESRTERTDRDEPKAKSDRPRPGSEYLRDRPKTQDRTRPDQPSPRPDSSIDRSRQERPKTDESRDRNKSERSRADEQRDRAKSEKSKVESQRDRTKTDRPKTEDPRNRPDRPKADDPREKNRQDRPGSEDQDRSKVNRSPSEDRQARTESKAPRTEPRKEQAKPGREEPRKEKAAPKSGTSERPKENPKSDRAKDSKDKDKDKDKDKKNP